MTEDIKEATAVMLEGKWMTITSADVLDNGWVRLSVPGGIGVTVRSSSIAAVKYIERRPQISIDYAFNIGEEK